MIKICKFRSQTGFGKFVTKDGNELRKTSCVALADGRFENVTMPWDRFGEFLAGLTPGEALSMGACFKHEEGRLVTKAKEPKLREPGCARTKENFRWHKPGTPYDNVLMFDIDDLGEIKTIESAAKRLLEIYPALQGLGQFWAFASAGANIVDNGTDVTGISGVHFYFKIPNQIPIETITEYLWVQGWLHDVSYHKLNPHDYGCAILERSFLDMSVFSPERFDFIGGTLCGEGLEQRREPPASFPGNEAESTHLERRFEVSGLEAAEAKRRQLDSKIKAKEEASALCINAKNGVSSGSMQALNEGVLTGEMGVLFDNHEQVKVWKLILYPEQYHGRTCHDPLHTDKGPNKAKFYYNEGNSEGFRYVVNSFAKGGTTYRLVASVEGIREMVAQTDTDTLKKIIMEERWLSELTSLDTETELPEILALLKQRGLGTKTELAARIGKEASKEIVAEKALTLESLNERFAYVDIGNKPRILEDTGDEILLRSRDDFLTCTEHLTVPAWKNGKRTLAPAGKEWLAWEKRRSYNSFEFNPSTTDREIMRNGKRIYNSFQGFAFIPKNERKCEKQYCNGNGCLSYFFEQCPGSLCPADPKTESNWTYWLKTIDDAVCANNLAHTRWVVDWFAELLQAPAGRWKGKELVRSGVSLAIRGSQGTGKGSVVWPILKILGRYGIVVSDFTSITHNFNAFMENKLLLFADEAVWAGSNKEKNKLKDLITGEDIPIERKGVDKMWAKNFLRFYIASNNAWVIPAEYDERRYTVFDIKDCYKEDQVWYEKVKNADFGELLAEMLSWEIKSNIFKNLDTEALRDQKEFAREPEEELLADMIESGEFWDKNGLGLPTSNKQIEELFLSRRVYGQYNSAHQMVRRFRKYLRTRGVELDRKSRIKVGSGWVQGFLMPPLQWFRDNTPHLCSDLN